LNDLAPADLRWLEAAARIAMPYRGTTAENPTVGAIVVSADGVVLGRGVTAPGGRPHAEPQALTMAGEGARGATLYVTLEPCNHWGQTPPCVDAVIASGVARVVCGAADADPRTAGQSIKKMRVAGIAVEVGSGLAAVERLHEGFFSRIRRGRPFVTAKLAVSWDGMIGRRDRGNVAITGEDARRWTHMQDGAAGQSQTQRSVAGSGRAHAFARGHGRASTAGEFDSFCHGFGTRDCFRCGKRPS
jgi:diaminohydroxyphosphoribosylaminopyrimidine deaminase/5-amino-6-(5-phosphoribosylamino)uracil reductase